MRCLFHPKRGPEAAPESLSSLGADGTQKELVLGSPNCDIGIIGAMCADTNEVIG